MQPRREPLLWLQCLAIGAIPLELLLIRLLLAGADPGPVPPLERLLLWSVAALAPAMALWRRPADWGSLLLLRIPLASRSKEQLELSREQGGLAGKLALLLLTLGLLPLIWWLDESAGLVQEFSPLRNPSRLVSLLLSTPLLALVVWQLQQLVQVIPWLSAGAIEAQGSATWDSESLSKERSSFGLQLLQLDVLAWPEVSPTPAASPSTSSESTPDASDVAGTAVSIEPEQEGEEQESPPLNAEVVEGDAVAGGEPEEHGEQPEASGSEESEPDETPESTPGSL